jgi:hypothetical protein
VYLAHAHAVPRATLALPRTHAAFLQRAQHLRTPPRRVVVALLLHSTPHRACTPMDSEAGSVGRRYGVF